MKVRLPRIIPCLLYQNGGLVKTINFINPTYIGDPINAVKIYNEMEADELIFLDIEASSKNSPPNLNLIKEIANEAFMPVCYGGGIMDIDTISKIINIGIEKVSLNTIVLNNPKLIETAASKFGSQSIVVCIDIKKNIFGEYEVFTNNGKIKSKTSLIQHLKNINNMGAGEIVVNNIDRDGKMIGFDLELLNFFRPLTNLPLIALGGAGNLNDLKEAVTIGKVDAVAAGSIFVYYGRLNGILINYPRRRKLKQLFENEI